MSCVVIQSYNRELVETWMRVFNGFHFTFHDSSNQIFCVLYLNSIYISLRWMLDWEYGQKYKHTILKISPLVQRTPFLSLLISWKCHRILDFDHQQLDILHANKVRKFPGLWSFFILILVSFSWYLWWRMQWYNIWDI